MFKRIILVTVSISFILFVLSWLVYPWLLETVIPDTGKSLIVTSIMDVLWHRLWTSIPFGILGIVLGVGVVICDYTISGRAKVYAHLTLVLVAVITIGGWIIFLKYRMAVILKSSFVGDIQAALSLINIPLYEIGIFSSLCVLITTLLLVIILKKGWLK